MAKKLGHDGPFPMQPKPSGKSQLVRSVESGSARYAKLQKISVIIDVKGTTDSDGWRNIRLEPAKNTRVPSDNIYDFSFVGDPPAGAEDVLTNVEASYQWFDPPTNITGIRITAATNKKVLSLPK